MHDDLVDAVGWAVEQGFADPARVAVFGGSYGGYAALVGISFTPGLFAAAVDFCGPSNLVTLLRNTPDPVKPYLTNNWPLYAGDPADPEQAADLWARSPLSKVADIRTPLLVVQGDRADRRDRPSAACRRWATGATPSRRVPTGWGALRHASRFPGRVTRPARSPAPRTVTVSGTGSPLWSGPRSLSVPYASVEHESLEEDQSGIVGVPARSGKNVHAAGRAAGLLRHHAGRRRLAVQPGGDRQPHLPPG
ncbi:alpha/beta hydrolase family protein [Streptomyces corynorhini]|uniref:alpha/beta hydrolase family protein n=1 Tax=Streptomyces corynorhini TaxID=2282652 RepID=UPI001F1625FE